MSCAGPGAFKAGPVRESSGIRFRLLYPEVQSVSIAGTFNNWNHTIHLLSEDPAGYWSILLSLPKGRYQYMFIIDHQTWIPDPEAEMMIDDGFGQKNSLLVVD
ncbi:MAG: glycogen-binding domain-containing protein [bacterium]